MYVFVLIPAISSLVSFLIFKNLAPKLLKEEITGEDVHKSHRPDLPEMGGLAIAGGFTAGILSVVGFNQFAGRLMTLTTSPNARDRKIRRPAAMMSLPTLRARGRMLKSVTMMRLIRRP